MGRTARPTRGRGSVLFLSPIRGGGKAGWVGLPTLGGGGMFWPAGPQQAGVFWPTGPQQAGVFWPTGPQQAGVFGKESAPAGRGLRRGAVLRLFFCSRSAAGVRRDGSVYQPPAGAGAGPGRRALRFQAALSEPENAALRLQTPALRPGERGSPDFPDTKRENEI